MEKWTEFDKGLYISSLGRIYNNKTKKLWKAKIMCWLINLACRLSGFKERCVVVKLVEQKDAK